MPATKDLCQPAEAKTLSLTVSMTGRSTVATVREIFEASRFLCGSPRLTLPSNDAKASLKLSGHHRSCACVRTASVCSSGQRWFEVRTEFDPVGQSGDHHDKSCARVRFPRSRVSCLLLPLIVFRALSASAPRVRAVQSKRRCTSRRSWQPCCDPPEQKHASSWLSCWHILEYQCTWDMCSHGYHGVGAGTQGSRQKCTRRLLQPCTHP